MKLALLPSTLLLFAPLAGAQSSVWIVDDDGGVGVDFSVLQDAIDFASDGDILLLQSGVYGPPPVFPPVSTTVSGKSLSIVADAGANPSVAGLVIEDLSLGQTVTMQGLQFDTTVELENNTGLVWIEDCDLVTPNFIGDPQPIEISGCAAVHINRCSLSAGSQILVRSSGLSAVNSSVYLYNSVLTGASGYGGTTLGGDGLAMTDGFLFASNTSINGGANGCGGDGLVLKGTSPVAITLGCDFTPGAPGMCTGDASVGVRVDAGTHTALTGTARSFGASSPVRTGESTALSFDGLPGDIVFGIFATDASAAYLASLNGTLLVPVGSYTIVSLGVVPASGILSSTALVSSVFGAGDVLYLQAAAFVPQVGFTLTGGSALVVLAP